MMKYFLWSICMLFLLTSCTPATPEKPVTYRSIQSEEAPTAIRQQLSNILHKGGHFSKVINNQIYVVIALGKRNTGGYRVTITKSEKKNRQLNVFAKEEAPDPNNFVTQVITYPFIIIVFSKDDIKKINIHFRQNNYSHSYNKEVK